MLTCAWTQAQLRFLLEKRKCVTQYAHVGVIISCFATLLNTMPNIFPHAPAEVAHQCVKLTHLGAQIRSGALGYL